MNTTCCCKRQSCETHLVEEQSNGNPLVPHVVMKRKAGVGRKNMKFACCSASANAGDCSSWVGRYKEVDDPFCKAPSTAEGSGFHYPFDGCVLRPFNPPTRVLRTRAEWDGQLVYKMLTREQSRVCTKEYRVRCLDPSVNASAARAEEGYVAIVTEGSCSQSDGLRASDGEPKIRYLGGYKNLLSLERRVCTNQKKTKVAIAVNPEDSREEQWLNRKGMCLSAQAVDPNAGYPLHDITDEILEAIPQSWKRWIVLTNTVSTCLCCKKDMSFLRKAKDFLGKKDFVKQQCKVAYATGPTRLDGNGTAANQEAFVGGTTYEIAKTIADIQIPIIGGLLFDAASARVCKSICAFRKSPEFDPFHRGVLYNLPGEALRTRIGLF